MTKKKVPEVLYKRLLQALKLRDNKLSWENIDRDLEWGFSDGMCVLLVLVIVSLVSFTFGGCLTNNFFFEWVGSTQCFCLKRHYDNFLE